jgi:protein SCO1
MHKSKILVSAICICLLLVILALVSWPAAAPAHAPALKTSTLVHPALGLGPFSLLDHHNRAFGLDELRGRWHFLAYGYLNCVDVCPTTLMLLSQLQHRLRQEGQYADLGILFYSIDPGRDTVDKLAQYVPFFGDDILGLRRQYAHEKSQAATRFEQRLGIVFKIADEKTAAGAVADYAVGHGLTLYLFDPRAELVAVFEPSIDPFKRRQLNPESLYLDYVALREYWQLSYSGS